DALTARHKGVMSRLNAAPKPPNVKSGHTVARYARPTPLRRALRLFFLASSKKWERCFKGVGRA
ncbi:hypothetical protein, partial [Klebsiella pneumoniae]|uniref:hypothetical protein n=1 Tax=Klebsiella TaxID=570 RepID=UPI003974D11E